MIKVVSDLSFFLERKEILIGIKATAPDLNGIMLAEALGFIHHLL